MLSLPLQGGAGEKGDQSTAEIRIVRKDTVRPNEYLDSTKIIIFLPFAKNTTIKLISDMFLLN